MTILPDKPVPASTLQLPPGTWATVLDCLCAHCAHVSRDQWLSRMARGRVLDLHGQPLHASTPYRTGLTVRYYREIEAERTIPFTESVLYIDENIVVADKPHFLPVTPKGRYVTQTLLARLMARLDLPQLAPLHRIDRGTAGLVMFSVNPATRALYHALFSERRIAKQYQAIAPALPHLSFPFVHRSRMVAGEPFFRMQDVSGSGLVKLIRTADQPVVVDFWAEWCGPCKAFAPTFTAAARQLSGQFIFAKLNTEQHGQAAQTYQIRSIPTLIVFKNGAEVDRQSGAMPQTMFMQYLARWKA